MCLSVQWVAGSAALAAAGWAFLRYFEWKNLYFPAGPITTTPAEFGLEYEDVVFVSEDGNALHGWWIPHARARGSVIHCHGNAGNIGDRAWLAADFHRLGLNVFLFDYRGYGQSRGLPTERGTYADARAAFEVVRAKYGDADNPPILVHGQSLGGAVAIQLACDRPVCGLIVESTFTSVVEMGRKLYPRLPVRAFIRYRYNSLEKIARIAVPKLISHSRTDELVPFEMGQQLFNAASEPREFVALAGTHGEAGWGTTPEYWPCVERFVDRVFGPASGDMQ
ncbi:MAG: Alpha/beta hydrolase family protein [Verrucomicrobia bacterium ADurb.Bin345]|nr:MAG: Alpha/beta hydrolase family protein [Verrucomicrobia bacterium ADurb.Bin345]